MLQSLIAAFPILESGAAFPFKTESTAANRPLIRLMNAHAPRAGCTLPGAIGEVISALAAEYGLSRFYTPNIGNTGNDALTIGADKPQPDLLIVAHMDRPSFRVRDHLTGEIYPVCALRLPENGYTCAARALRYDPASRSMVAAAAGKFRAEGGSLRFLAETGNLLPLDTVVMDAEPRFEDGIITGTGLDNTLGVLTALGAAFAFAAGVNRLNAENKQIMIVFTDEEEGIPEVFFGHGAARLAQIVRPTLGAIICDAQTVGDNTPIQMGSGGAHGVISGAGKGALVPPNAAVLAADLITEINQWKPGTAQLNTGYLSRSDDMGTSRWTRVLGMIGVPMLDPHTAHESAVLADVGNAALWLTTYAAAVLGLSPHIKQMYRL